MLLDRFTNSVHAEAVVQDDELTAVDHSDHATPHDLLKLERKLIFNVM